MELSIIIVNFNTRIAINNCLDSIYKTIDDIEFEVIVIDNNSSDNSVKSLDKFKKLQKNFRLIINRENLGFSKANNQGIGISKGKYILLLNSDTEVKNGAVNKLLEFAKSRVDAGVVGPKLVNVDGSTQDSVMKFPTIGNAVRAFFLGKPEYFGKHAPQSQNPVEVDAVVGAAFLITPLAIKKLGGLNEKYFFYYEDLDYCRNVNKFGLKVYYYPDSIVTHIHGLSGKRITDEKNQWRRLIPSSKIYHGLAKYYLLTMVLWLGQKWQKFVKVIK